MVLEKDLLDQVLDGGKLRPMDVIKQPLVLPERTSVVQVLDIFKASPVRLAIVIDEYEPLRVSLPRQTCWRQLRRPSRVRIREQISSYARTVHCSSMR